VPTVQELVFCGGAREALLLGQHLGVNPYRAPQLLVINYACNPEAKPSKVTPPLVFNTGNVGPQASLLPTTCIKYQIV
jgi:hypothetical protein